MHENWYASNLFSLQCWINIKKGNYPKTQFFELKAHHPDIAHYHVDENQEKIAAGWLIESCGWKGKRIGDCGTWKNQALVIVNYANASGQDIYDFSERIITDVKNKFGIILEREVNVV